MRRRLIILILLFACMAVSSCKAKKVIIPDKDNSKVWQKTEKHETYEKAVKDHWAMQPPEVKRYAKRNKKMSEAFNANKKHKKKAKACNNCNDAAAMDGVRDIK